MIHPDTELRFINPEIGYGVFATQFIPRGTITWVRECKCSSPRCRKWIAANDVVKQVDEWTALMRNGFRVMKKVPQPLSPLIREEDIQLSVNFTLTSIPLIRQSLFEYKLKFG